MTATAPAATGKYQRSNTQPDNPFLNLIQGQTLATVPSFTLESGVTLYNVPVAYKTWGVLNANADNAMIICHALSGSADVADWWGPLIGPGKAFDTTRFFIICCNTLGSPYGTASPVTKDPQSGEYYGPEFPLTTIRDDVRLHKLVLDDLGVRQIAACIGGSMGGMQVLEWSYFGPDYVRAIVPIATSSRHSAWCISWAEAQRQSISADPKYADGYYSFSDPPVAGLGAARMSALLTYRSRNSFESRFGRNTPDPAKHAYISSKARRQPTTPAEEHWSIHTDGFNTCKKLDTPPGSPAQENTPPRSTTSSTPEKKKDKPSHFFSAQTYLRYQGQKFVSRFDANCYIAITRKLDTHDVSRGRTDNVQDALRQISQPTLVIGIETDGLFTYAEQQELAEFIPNARLATIVSPEGHDAFLLQFEEVNGHILEFLREVLPEKMGDEGVVARAEEVLVAGDGSGGVGEVDDITAW